MKTIRFEDGNGVLTMMTSKQFMETVGTHAPDRVWLVMDPRDTDKPAGSEVSMFLLTRERLDSYQFTGDAMVTEFRWDGKKYVVA